MGSFIRVFFRVLSSNGLATILLLLLLLLTFLGTWEQMDEGIFQVQQKYFDSLFLVHWVFDTIPIPLPGVYLLMILLAVNLIVGGVYRVKWRLSKAGILIAHLGIAFLLVAGFLTMKLSVGGYVKLYEGEASSEFLSHNDWEVAIYKVPGPGRQEITEYLIPTPDLEELGGRAYRHRSKIFTSEKLPFDLELSGYLQNSEPKYVGQHAAKMPNQVDGIYLEERPVDSTSEANVRGVHVKVKEKDSGRETETLLWGLQRHPLTVTVDGARFAIDLRKAQKPLPFAVRLNEFIHELHPRTSMPKVFMSKVTRIEHGTEQEARISMNQPLRHKGYTLYQSSWGPPNAGPDTKLYSVLAVVQNPVDQLPMWATVVICFGILLQSLLRLFLYLRSEAGGRS